MVPSYWLVRRPRSQKNSYLSRTTRWRPGRGYRPYNTNRHRQRLGLAGAIARIVRTHLGSRLGQAWLAISHHPRWCYCHACAGPNRRQARSLAEVEVPRPNPDCISRSRKRHPRDDLRREHGVQLRDHSTLDFDHHKCHQLSGQHERTLRWAWPD